MYKRLHLLLGYLLNAWQEKKHRLVHWFWLLLGYFLSQVVIQALNFVGGVIIIRFLSKDDYANYTIINTMGPVLVILSDNGINIALMSIGRKIWQDNEKMGGLIRTGMSLRRMFGLFSVIIVSPVLAWMLARNHASVQTIALLMIIVLVGGWFQMTSGLMKVVIELRQQVASLRNVGLAGACVRFVFLTGCAYFFFMNAWLATLAAACAGGVEAWLYVRAVRSQIDWHAPPQPEYRSAIFSMVKKTAPLMTYYCIQSQISIWLISIFGKAHQVADIGALWRLGMIFTVLGSGYTAIAIPLFSRSHGRRQLILRFWQIIGSFVAILTIITILTKLFPGPLIFILGEKYANLTDMVWLAILAMGLALFFGLAWGMSASKGWVVPAIILIPLEILTQVILLLSFDLSVSLNVVIFSCLSCIPPGIMTIAFLWRHINREED